MNNKSTITAISSAPGGAISVIRVSGPDSVKISSAVWCSRSKIELYPRKFIYGICHTNKIQSEPALAVYMPAPKSYTGEDVVEIHCHGSGVVSKRIVEALISAGARQAEPGEFTYRAFLNGKMDLTQAEAVADLISSGSDMAANMAEKMLSGELGAKIRNLRNKLTGFLSECEIRLDFSEEDIAVTDTKNLLNGIKEILCEIRTLLKSKDRGIILREGVKIVIAGKPNSGKSSLLNCLLCQDRAIVSEIPGTTRDTLEEKTNLRNIPVCLIDTAGIRDADCIIEKLGMERTVRSMKTAGIVFWLLSPLENHSEELSFMKKHAGMRKGLIAIWNKCDLVPEPELLPETDFPTARISAINGNGIEKLLDLFEREVWGNSLHHNENEIAVNIRHAGLLNETENCLIVALKELSGNHHELASIHIREASSCLGKIIGEDISPDILDEIFSRFCIGK